MEKIIVIFFSVVLINNFVLSRFLGLCPFLGVSRESGAALSMGLAVTFVMTMASIVTWFFYYFFLVPYQLEFLQTIVFILVIATFVQFVEMVMAKTSPALQEALGIYLPLITTNCAVLGVSLLNVREGYSLIETTVNGFGGGLGFTVAILLMANIRERLEFCDIPECMKGFPISFIVTSMLAFSFFGFQGFFSK
ncbi:MAG: RnfABCDGE type electron transport complex subunit A [Proteobacteria bacterium]|nr:RnfABCDGE type electron transport complex subunit A [Pseudomonadota bacterium]